MGAGGRFLHIVAREAECLEGIPGLIWPGSVSGCSGYTTGGLVENIDRSHRQIEVEAFPFPLTYIIAPLPITDQLQFVKAFDPIL